MNDTISEEMAMPDHIPEYHRKEENQNDVTYYLNSVNNISQFIQNKRQETIKAGSVGFAEMQNKENLLKGMVVPTFSTVIMS
jgi:hypothetical protein